MSLTKLSGRQIETPVDISAVNLTGITTAANLNVTGVSTLSSAIVGSAVTITAGGIVAGLSTITNFRATHINISGVTTVAAGSVSAPSITPTGDTNTGIFFPSADTIAFGEGGSEAVRIDSLGRLGVGAADPGYAIDVASADTTAGIGYALRLRQNATAGAAAIQFTDNPANTQYGYIACDSSSNLKFATGTFERFRVDSSGRVGIGTTSPAYAIDVASADTTAGIGYALRLRQNTTAGAAAIQFTNNPVTAQYGYIACDSSSNLKFATGDTERLRITSAGNTHQFAFFRHFNLGWSVTSYKYTGLDQNGAYVVFNEGNTGVYLTSAGTSWTGYSDERLKTNLVEIENGLQKVGQLRAVTGRFKKDPEDVSRSFLIAQDVQAVLPEAVDTSNPDALGLSYTDVIPLLVAALKESKERIEALEAEVAAFKVQ